MAKLAIRCAARLADNAASASAEVQTSIEVDAEMQPEGGFLSVFRLKEGLPATHEFVVDDLDRLTGTRTGKENSTRMAHDLLTAVNLQSDRAIWMDRPSDSLAAIYEDDPLPQPPDEVHQEENTIHIRIHAAVRSSISAIIQLEAKQQLDHDQVVAEFQLIQRHRSATSPDPVLDRALENYMRGCNSTMGDSQITAWWAAIEQASGTLGEGTSGKPLVAAASTRAAVPYGDVDEMRIVNNRIKHGSTGTQHEERIYAAYKANPGRLAKAAHATVRAMVQDALRNIGP